MDDPSKRCCSCKSTAKFFLIYLVTLQVLVLLFTAFTNEPLNSEQLKWYWIFLVSLLITTALTSTSLVIILCNEFYSIPLNALDSPGNITEQTGIVSVDQQPRSPSVQAPMRINSLRQGDLPLTSRQTSSRRDLDQIRENDTADRQSPELSTKFINLTPTTRQKPVTVVDMPAINATKRAEIGKLDDANFGAVPSNNLATSQRKKERRKRYLHMRKNQRR